MADGNGNWLILTGIGQLMSLRSCLRLEGFLPYQSAALHRQVGMNIKGDLLIGRWFPLGDALVILRVDGKYTNERVELDRDLYYVGAFGSMFIFRVDSTDPSLIQYVSYVVGADGTVSRLSHAPSLEYAKKSVPGCTVRGQVINYQGNPLLQGLQQIDDDGNFYESRIVVVSGVDSVLVKSSIDGSLPSSFDCEGNLWAINFSKDRNENPVFLYAGRDWGYKEAPRNAVATADGLRVRLRSTTDGFILGKLSSGQRVTVLKTGRTESVGGKTAPWYRIRTSDGLIGWVFGGFLEIQK